MTRARHTRQLAAILEAVSAAHDHPTAEQVYSRVRDRLPRVSLGTVYRNLQKLAEQQRVRKALSIAINRQAIAQRIMEGKAVPAGQLLPDFFFGTSKKLKPDRYDPQGAKKLLAEAMLDNAMLKDINSKKW